MKKENLEIYIHIPFCVRKCFYCDFLSAPADDATRERYVEALLAEIAGRSAEFAGYEVVSVFFGGGTPSVLPAKSIEKIMNCLKEQFLFAEQTEITIEVNPGTVDEEKLAVYHACGINRLSIGLQSSVNEELKRIGRIHDREQFLETYKAACRAGFTNINVDLMSTLPGQSLESFRESLRFVTGLEPAPTHISAYSLILEEGTPLFQAVEKGLEAVPDEDLDREMYGLTKQFLQEAGYERYEISNYAGKGMECRHNCGYWTGTQYIGFGIGAASYVQGKRFSNGESLAEYLEHPLECRGAEELLTEQDRMEEFMFLGLRMTNGVSKERFKELFSVPMEQIYGEVIAKNTEDGLLKETRREETGETFLSLTEKGLDVSNYVMAQFIQDK